MWSSRPGSTTAEPYTKIPRVRLDDPTRLLRRVELHGIHQSETSSGARNHCDPGQSGDKSTLCIEEVAYSLTAVWLVHGPSPRARAHLRIAILDHAILGHCVTEYSVDHRCPFTESFWWCGVV